MVRIGRNSSGYEHTRLDKNVGCASPRVNSRAYWDMRLNGAGMRIVEIWLNRSPIPDSHRSLKKIND